MPAGLLYTQSVIAVDGLRPATIITPAGLLVPASLGVPVVGAVGGGTVSTFTAIDRDTISAAGGATLTLTVSGISGLPPATLNGVSCTGVTVVNSTTITCVTPAVAVGGPYAMVCGGMSLANAVTVLPAAGTVFANVNFETAGTLSQAISPCITDGGSPGCSITTALAHSGTHSLQCQTPTTANVSGKVVDIWYKFANNAVLNTRNPNGIYFRWYQAYDATAIANAMVGSGDAYKTHLARYLDSGAGQPGGLEIGFGTAAAGNGHFTDVIDNGLVGVVDLGKGPVANQWDEWQVWYTRDPVTSTTQSKLWLNGKLLDSRTHADSAGNAMFTNLDRPGDTTHDLYFQIGIPWVDQSTDSVASGAGIAYVDDVKIADGFIDP